MSTVLVVHKVHFSKLRIFSQFNVHMFALDVTELHYYVSLCGCCHVAGCFLPMYTIFSDCICEVVSDGKCESTLHSRSYHEHVWDYTRYLCTLDLLVTSILDFVHSASTVSVKMASKQQATSSPTSGPEIK